MFLLNLISSLLRQESGWEERVQNDLFYVGRRSKDLVDVVVEVDVASTQVTTEHRGVCREDGRNVDVTSATYDQSNTGDPLVKMSHQVRRAFDMFLILTDTQTDRFIIQ